MEKSFNSIYSFNTIYLDTSSVMRPQFLSFMRMIIPKIKNNDKCPVVVLQQVMNELRVLSHREDNETAQKARQALEGLNALFKADLLVLKGNPNDHSIPDSLFMEIAMHARHTGESTLFITQDFQLAKELLSVNKLSSSRGTSCKALKINKYGMLEEFDFSKDRPSLSFQPLHTYHSPRVAHPYDRKTTLILKRFGL